MRPDLPASFVRRTHLRKEHGTHQAHEVPGVPPNAETLVELLDAVGGLGLYRLVPRTGRTHQLRCQLSALGIPILGDPLYPVEVDVAADDFGSPLQLLAAVLAFADPVDGTPRRFVSRRRLEAWPGDWPGDWPSV